MDKKETQNTIWKLFGSLKLGDERKREFLEAIRNRREEIDKECLERQRKIRARLDEIARKKRGTRKA